MVGKKVFLTGFILSYLVLPLSAQSWQKALDKAARQAAGKNLSDRLQHSKEHLKSVMAAFPPEKHISKLVKNSYAPVAPYSVLSKTDPVSQIWADVSNKLDAAYRIVRERQLNFLRRHEAEISKQLVFLPFAEGASLVQRIRPDVKYIFLGEESFLSMARSHVRNVLWEYQKKYPKRQLILLTEFAQDSGLEEVRRFAKTGPLAEYAPILQSIKSRGIKVVGLEEAPAPKYFYLKNGQLVKGSSISQGIQLRRLHWAERIKQWREKYPQAVFFIYTGADHCLYDTPGSLPNLLSEKEMYVSILQSGRLDNASFFHTWTQFNYLKKGAWLVQNKKWAKHIGFDEQIIFP